MPRLLVLYHSQDYGHTGQMAAAVAEGARQAGCEVVLHNTNDARFDVATFADYDAAAFGSPDYFSYIAGGLKTFLDDHYVLDVRRGASGLTGKPYALFCSHGGGGRVAAIMAGLFRRVGTQVGDTLACRGAPDEAKLEQCRALGLALAGAALG